MNGQEFYLMKYMKGHGNLSFWLIKGPKGLTDAEKYNTANLSLGQDDEEVNKRKKQKIYVFKQTAQYFSLKTNLLQRLKEK